MQCQYALSIPTDDHGTGVLIRFTPHLRVKQSIAVERLKYLYVVVCFCLIVMFDGLIATDISEMS